MDTVNSQIVENVGDFAPVIQVESLREVARRYRQARLNVLPADRKLKRPIGKWKEWTKTVGDFDDVFPDDLQFDALAVVCGATSGGLEVVDFDQKARAFEAFKAAFGSLDGFPVETTQSEGKHIAFRSDCYGRNQRLALDEKDEVLIETRGQGGICIIAPSDGYSLESGSWVELPILESCERERLLDAARSLNRGKLTTATPTTKRTATASKLPVLSTTESAREWASDYLRRNLDIVRDALARADWKFERKGVCDGLACEYWSRPNQSVEGKPGGSLGLEGGLLGNFHVFTSNAPGFDLDGNYSPLRVVARLEFGGDESAAARDIWRRYMGSSRKPRVIDCINRDELATPINEITVSTANPSAPAETRAQRKRRQLDQLAELDLLSAVPDFPAWAVPKSLLDYCEAQSKAEKIPVPALVAMALTDFSGLVARLWSFPVDALGRRKRIYTNLATVAIGGSGDGKSAGLGAVGKPLERIEAIVAQEREKIDAAIRADLEARDEAKREKKKLESKRRRAGVDERDEIDKRLDELDDLIFSKEPVAPPVRLIRVKPGTAEAATDICIKQLRYQSAPIFRADESSSFFSATYNTKGDVALLETYSGLVDGTSETVVYKTQELDPAGLNKVRLAAFNLATQDETIRDCFKDKTKKRQGFYNRLLFVLARADDSYFDETETRVVDELENAFCVPYLRAYASCVLKENTEIETDEASARVEWARANGGVPSFDLYFDSEFGAGQVDSAAPSARKVFKAFSDYAQDRKRELREAGRIEARAAYSKLFTIAERLAGLLFAWDYLESGGRGLRFVNWEIAERAVALARWYGLHRETVEQILDQSESESVFSLPTVCTVLAQRLANEPDKAFSKSELVKGIKSLEGKKNAATFEKCVATLVEKGYCRIVRETRGNNEREYYQYIPESADAEELEGGENE